MVPPRHYWDVKSKAIDNNGMSQSNPPRHPRFWAFLSISGYAGVDAVCPVRTQTAAAEEYSRLSPTRQATAHGVGGRRTTPCLMSAGKLECWNAFEQKHYLVLRSIILLVKTYIHDLLLVVTSSKKQKQWWYSNCDTSVPPTLCVARRYSCVRGDRFPSRYFGYILRYTYSSISVTPAECKTPEPTTVSPAWRRTAR